MNQQQIDKKNRIKAIAAQGWHNYFSYLFEGEFKMAIEALRQSKESVRMELNAV